MNQKQSTHYYWLDLLRFLAAFLVLMCHFRGAFFEEYTLLSSDQQNWATFIFYSCTRLGDEAVLVFFVLSGFLVGGKAIERVRSHSFDVEGYAIDRIVRIMLPLISALLLYIPVTIFVGNEINWWAWLCNLFSLQGIYAVAVIEPLWSLSYEVWFYILMGGFAFFFMKGDYNKKLLAGLVVFVAFLVFTKLSTHYLLMWIMGALAYLMTPSKKNKTVFILSIIALLILIVVLQVTSGSHLQTGLDMILPTKNRGSLQLFFAFFFCVFIQQLILRKPSSKLTEYINKVGTKLAAFSYTLYLTHVLVLRFLEKMNAPKSTIINLNSLFLYFSWLLLAVIVAYIVYLGFEKRTGDVKKYIRKKIN